jgi:hypothetical protein
VAEAAVTHDWKLRTAQSPAYTRTRRPIAGTVRQSYSTACSCGFTSGWYAVRFIAEARMKDHLKEVASHG